MMSALALMSACSNDEKEIREVAYNYSYALANYKIEDATQYCTKETQETSLAYGLELMKGVSAEYIASDTPATIEIEGIEMTSDTTATAQYHKKTPIKDFMAKVNIVKRDGKWLVHDPMVTTQDSKNQEEKVVVADTIKRNGKEVVLYHFEPKKEK